MFYFKERLSDFGVLVRGFVILVNLGAVLLGWLICARDFISLLYLEIRVFINERNDVDLDSWAGEYSTNVPTVSLSFEWLISVSSVSRDNVSCASFEVFVSFVPLSGLEILYYIRRFHSF